MVTKTAIKVSALKFISGTNEHICRLCLVSTENYNVCLDTTVVHSTCYCDESVTFYDMFQNLGWLQIDINDEMPQELCGGCAKSVINSYLFMKQCEYSNENWRSILNRLNDSITQTEAVSPSTQTLYIIINNNNSIIYTSRKRHNLNSKETALKKVKTLVKSRSNYEKSKCESVAECEQCGEHFESQFALNRHLRTHDNSINNCSHCTRTFSTVQKLNEHVERMHYPKTIQCCKCEKMFSTNKMLKQHERLHHEAVVCKVCFMQLASRNALRTHLDKHEVLKCSKCKKSYLNKWTFKFHSKNCGVRHKDPSFFCDICNKGYVRKNGLRTHLKIDHGFGKVITCKWCNKKFDAVSRLKMHIVKHTKERNFQCGTCGGKFVTLAALVYHTRLHTGEKPFPCDLCNESFLSASRRMEHKHRKHFGPKHNCHMCLSKFVTRTQLMKHVERHYNPQSKLYMPDAKQSNQNAATGDEVAL